MQELSNLLEKPDVDPNKLNGMGDAPLHTLAKRDVKTKKKLDLLYTFMVGQNDDSDDEEEEEERTDASSQDYADVNLPNRSGNTPLHFAAQVCVCV